MVTFITVVSIILSVTIIILVMLQQGKGSDMGAAFGGGSSLGQQVQQGFWVS